MRTPARLRRDKSFFGIHYDFHCQATDRDVGRRVTPAMVREVLSRLRPDYIQIDCKGHPGVTSYPGRHGASAPRFVRDPLRIWRRETARAGVALFMHYSGVWDSAAVRAHSDWAAVDADGKRSERATSVFGPYVDERMIPQLLELAREYGVDGAWVDGDCWATVRDYSKRARAEWRKRTGHARMPRDAKDPLWHEFGAFCRDGFREYVKHYVDALHREAPGFQVASNWAYSSHMPEWPTINVDFLSGDFWPHDSINSARFEGRILASQGKPWDLMSWGFGTRSDDQFRHRVPKTATQLQQEAALVLALGGGYQCYFSQKRDGSISRHDLDIYEPVAAFCRERQRWCQGGESAAEVAILYSTGGLYRNAPGLFSPWGGVADPFRGALSALVEAGVPLDAVHDGHVLDGRLPYRLVVIPEWEFLEPPVRSALVRFAKRGGNILVIGTATARMFARELGVRLGPDTAAARRYACLAGNRGELIGLFGAFPRSVIPLRGTKRLGRLYAEHDHTGPHQPAATVRRLGLGRIAAWYAPFGSRYLTGSSAAARRGLKLLVDRLLPDPAVALLSDAAVDVVARRRDGALLVHLCNTAGAGTAALAWDRVPRTGPLTLALRLERTPASVRMQPGHRTLRWTRRDGCVHVAVPSIALHGVVVIEFRRGAGTPTGPEHRHAVRRHR